MLSQSTGRIESPEVVRLSALPDEDRARGNVYALLGNLLAGPPDAGMLQMLRGIIARDRRLQPAGRRLADAGGSGVAHRP